MFVHLLLIGIAVFMCKSFQNLKTVYVGRLVIYAPVVSSSQHVVTDLELTNGIAVIPRQQTSGVGRSNNQVSFFYLQNILLQTYS